MKKLVSALVGAGAISAFAAVHEVTDVSQLSSSYGNDTLSYTGPSATSDQALTLDAGASGKATTVSVADGSTLTLTGGLAINHLFFKYGPGVLCVAPADGGDVTWANEGSDYGSGGTSITWADGAASGTFMGFNVAEGTFQWNGTGTLKGYNLTVGEDVAEGAKNVRFEVNNGKVELSNLLVIDHNNSRTGGDVENKVVINKDAEMKVQSVWAGITSQTRASKPETEVNGGTLTVTRNYWAPYGNGDSYLTVKNGGTLDALLNAGNVVSRMADMEADDGSAVRLGYSGWNGYGTLEVTGEGSLAKIARLDAVRGKSTVKVNDGGVLKLESPARPYLRAKSQTIGGKLAIDGGALEPLDAAASTEWFPFGEQHTVGANGGTVTTKTISSLGGWLTGAGTLTKNGAGYVTLMPSAAPIHVAEGGVGFHAFNKNATDAAALSAANGDVTVANGAYARVMGKDALSGMTLNAGDGTYVYGTTGLDHDFDVSDWTFLNAAMPRSDGWFRLTDARLASLAGAVWRTTKMDVSQSFTVSFDYYVTKLGTAAGAYVPFGVAAVWQTEGTNVQKTTSSCQRSLGYATPTKRWLNSFAVGYDAAGSDVKYAVTDENNASYFLIGNGESDQYGVNGMTGSSFARPVTVTIKYDQPNQKMTTTVVSGDGTVWTIAKESVDLVKLCGANEAYFGFTATDWQSETANRGEHFVGNVRTSYDSPAAATTVGGVAKLAAGATFKAQLATDAFNTSWQMNALSRAGDATLQVAGPVDEALAFRQILGAGMLEKTGAAGLALGNALGTMAGTLKMTGGALVLNPSTGAEFAANAGNWWLCDDDHFADSVGGSINTADNSITVGRNVNKDHLFNDLVALRHKLSVNQPWRIAWHGTIESQVAYGSKWMSFILHNDPRGYTAKGTDYGAAYGIANSVTFAWQEKSTQASYGNGFAYMFKGAGLTELWRDSFAGTIDMKVGYEAGSEMLKEVDFAIEYDPATTTLTFTMSQPGEEGEKVFSKSQVIDLAAEVGDTAYVAFGVTSAAQWFDIKQTIGDFSFTSAGDATMAYVDNLVLNGANKINQIRLNATAADEVFKIANTISAPDGTRLALLGSGVATAGAVNCPDGTVIQDAGTFLVDTGTLNVKTWDMRNGAKLMVPAGKTVQIGRVRANLKLIDGGVYTKDNCDFVTGDGAVEVAAPLGMMILVH